MNRRACAGIAAAVLAGAALTGASVAAAARTTSSPVALATVHIAPTSAATAQGSRPTADLTLEQTGPVFTEAGTGHNFSRDGIYFSVIYNRGSNATTCTPDGTLDFGSMIAGVWLPVGATDRTFVPIPHETTGYNAMTMSKAWYVSIREASTKLVENTRQTLGQTFLLAACGAVHPVSGAGTPIRVPRTLPRLPGTPPVTVPGIPPVTLPTVPVTVTVPPITLPALARRG